MQNVPVRSVFIDKNGEDDLSPDEEREMKDFARIDNMMTLKQASE